MLVEVRRWTGRGPFSVYVPADPAGPCRRLAARDWRYLLRFHAAEAATVRTTGQTRYAFASAAANAVIAAAEPHLEESDAG